jgi:hypothetical protein
LYFDFEIISLTYAVAIGTSRPESGEIEAAELTDDDEVHGHAFVLFAPGKDVRPGEGRLPSGPGSKLSTFDLLARNKAAPFSVAGNPATAARRVRQ